MANKIILGVLWTICCIVFVACIFVGIAQGAYWFIPMWMVIASLDGINAFLNFRAAYNYYKLIKKCKRNRR